MQPVPNYDASKIPADWWQRFDSARILIEHFRQYVVGMLIGVNSQSIFQYSVFTGVPIEFKGRLFWVTAGHVVERIESVLACPDFTIAVMRWLDMYGLDTPPALPVQHRDSRKVSWKYEGVDAGVIELTGMDARLIQANPHVAIRDMTNWRVDEAAEPEGYFALGYPEVWTEFSQVQVTERQVRRNVKADLINLPLRRIGPPLDLGGV